MKHWILAIIACLLVSIPNAVAINKPDSLRVSVYQEIVNHVVDSAKDKATKIWDETTIINDSTKKLIIENINLTKADVEKLKSECIDVVTDAVNNKIISEVEKWWENFKKQN